MNPLLTLMDVTIDGGPLSQQKALNALRKGFETQADRSDLLIGLLVATALLGIIAMLVRWRMGSNHTERRTPVDHLYEVLSRVDLSETQRRLVVQIAKSQAQHLGATELSRSADLTNAALTEMTGATSPRLHLELLMARLLLPAADDSREGLAARLDRLERRMDQLEVRMTALEDRLAGLDARLTGRMDALEVEMRAGFVEMREGFAKMRAGMAHIVSLLERDSGD